jgi:transcription initiation factor IIF auxiliary subunit
MTMRDMPYFMTNEDWYEFDFEKRIFVLTDKAPEKAKESYEEYLKQRTD